DPALVRPCREGGCFSPRFSAAIRRKFTISTKVFLAFPALSGPAATMRTMVGRRVVMYSRSTCHLCDEARAVIEAERDRTPFDFEERCIDGDDRLERDYGLRVPVVEVDGAEEFEFVVDPRRLAQLMR